MTMSTQVKPFTYGDGEAIRILAAQAIGLTTHHAEVAKSWLAGKSVHPMTAAAMSKEATTLHNQIRCDESRVNAANTKAQEIKALYGWS